MYYTGIGSRETPFEILTLMTRIAQRLAARGWTLRSGGADGADSAFERGAGDKQIYLPWPRFNGNSSRFTSPTPAALEMAADFHPAWDRCSQGARKLHARNCHQVLGIDLATPSTLVICWTRGGSGAGGTGQALRIARAHDIPIFDLGHSNRPVVLNAIASLVNAPDH